MSWWAYEISKLCQLKVSRNLIDENVLSRGFFSITRAFRLQLNALCQPKREDIRFKVDFFRKICWQMED